MPLCVLELLLLRLQLPLGGLGVAPQTVGAVAGRLGDALQRVERRLVLRDRRGQRGVLLPERDVRRGVGQDVGERAGREDLLEQRGLLCPIGVGQALAQLTLARLQVLLALGDLVFEQREREVELSQLFRQLVVMRLDDVDRRPTPT